MLESGGAMDYDFSPMNTKKPTTPPNPEHEFELAGYRRNIDDIDDKLIELLKERINVVSKVGEFKRRTAPGICPIRPGREADMVHRVMKGFEGSAFPPAAAAAMWRTLIGASTSTESTLIISVFTPENDNDLYWMAREYFGPFIQVIKQPYIKRVIGDVMDGKANVGVVPMLRSSDSTYWWTNLTQQSHDIPKVFARIPFVYHGVPNRDSPSGLAIARLTPEKTGDDHSLIVLEVDHNVSQNKLQTTFANAKLEANWINIATLTPSARHHLIEVKGFVTEQSKAIQSVLAALGNSVFNASFLGNYAIPVIIDNSKPVQESHVVEA
jgi:chorismate mutase